MSDPRNPVTPPTPPQPVGQPVSTVDWFRRGPTGGGTSNFAPVGDPTHSTNSDPADEIRQAIFADLTEDFTEESITDLFMASGNACMVRDAAVRVAVAREDALRADAVQSRKDFIDLYCTRRIDHREGDFTQEQLAKWQQAAAASWAEKYPAFAKLAGGVDR